MLAKDLVCPCHKDNIDADDYAKYIKKHIHFHCNCTDEHEIFVLTCSGHPFFFNSFTEMRDKCYCKSLGPFETYNFCVKRRYLLNFRCYKFSFVIFPKKVGKFFIALDEDFSNENKC